MISPPSGRRGAVPAAPVRTLKPVIIRKSGDMIEVRLEADSFLQYMVRNITGTLVEVGLGRFRPEEVKQMLCPATAPLRDVPLRRMACTWCASSIRNRTSCYFRKFVREINIFSFMQMMLRSIQSNINQLSLA